MNTHSAVNPIKRLAYAFVGLLVGDAMLFLYLLLNALQGLTLYAIFSLIGWLFVGVPVVLFLPARSVTRWSWPFSIAVGAFLGPPALLVVLVLLGRGHIHFPASFVGTGPMFAFSIFVSTVSFGVYVALLRKQLGGTN